MTNFDQELNARLAALREQNLYRTLRLIEGPQSTRLETGGRRLVNFSSNDYLALANDSVLKEAAVRAIEQFGAGSGASRLICGSLAPHLRLEETLAAFKGTAAALTFSTGYAAALGTIGALMDKNDVVVVDKLVHACLVDAARLSGAKLRVFAHNNLNELEEILKWADQWLAANLSQNDQPSVPSGPSGAPARRSRALIVTESVFSMDGDHAPLRELVELKEKYGAWLMVDEAHATGLYGAKRRGWAEAMGVSDRIEIQMGTLGKALGSAGGFICGSRQLIDYLINRARSFVFSTAPAPAAAAAAEAAVRFVQSPGGAGRCEQLWQRVREFSARQSSGRRPSIPHAECGASKPSSAIIAWLIGGEAKALEASGALADRGIFVPAIRYPTVARGQARLRVTITAAHTEAEVKELCTCLEALGAQPSFANGA